MPEQKSEISGHRGNRHTHHTQREYTAVPSPDSSASLRPAAYVAERSMETSIRLHSHPALQGLSERDQHTLVGALLIEGAFCGRDDAATVTRTMHRWRSEYFDPAVRVRPAEWRRALALLVHCQQRRRDVERLAALLRGDDGDRTRDELDLPLVEFTDARPVRPRAPRPARRFTRA